MLDRAATHGSDFKPGTRFEYSNTNYIMLGRILEKTGGAPLERQIRDQILRPLGMKDTFLRGREPIPGSNTAQGSIHEKGRFIDVTNDEHPSIAWAAGAMVSNVPDMLAFSRALFGGKLLSQRSMKEMLTPPVLADGKRSSYGMGIGVDQSPYGVIYSHGGSISGFGSTFSYLPSRGVHMVTLANTEVDPKVEDPVAERTSYELARTLFSRAGR